MDLTKRQQWELPLVLALSALVAGIAVSAGRFDLPSGTQTTVLYERGYAQPNDGLGSEDRLEGDWVITPEGLRLRSGQSGSLTIRLQDTHAGRPQLSLYGQRGAAAHWSLSGSGDGRVFRELARSFYWDGTQINLTDAAGHPETVWLRVSVTVDPSVTPADSAVLSRLRVVTQGPRLLIPNLPIASLILLTPLLAYLTRANVRPTGALPYSLAVLCGLAILAEAIVRTRMSDPSLRWWERVLAGTENGCYFLVPYAVLLGLFAWHARLGRGSFHPESGRLWSQFALVGILAWGGSSRLGALAEVGAARVDPDAVKYMQLAAKMSSPYDTEAWEPLWIWVIKGWFWLTGDSYLHLRLLTVGLSLLVVVIAYKLFRDYTGRRLVGLLVAALLALNPYLISLSVRGLREEAYLIATLCLVYVAVVPHRKWSLKGQAIGLALSGAAAQLLRFNSYVFVIPLLLLWAWKQGGGRWKAVAVPLAFLAAVSVPHLMHNAREYGDPMYSVNIHFAWARNFEFVTLKQQGCDGCPSQEQMKANFLAGRPLGGYEYVFGMHSLAEVVGTTLRGYRDMYLWPTPLFEIQTGTRSSLGYGLYLLGLGLVLFGSYREVLVVIVLLANGVPFAMALGIDPRLGVQTAPFVTFILAFAVWWVCERATCLWKSPIVQSWALRVRDGDALRVSRSSAMRQ